MTTPVVLPRSLRLRMWMTEHNITYQDMAEQLGIAKQAAQNFLTRDCMPVRYHEKCVVLGVPVELLPMPFDKPSGRPKGAKPNFPGLATASNDAHA